MGKRGPVGTVIYSRVYRIALSQVDRDLLAFFTALDKLPPGRRNAALLAAIRGGQSAAQSEIERKESKRTSRALDALLGDLGD